MRQAYVPRMPCAAYQPRDAERGVLYRVVEAHLWRVGEEPGAPWVFSNAPRHAHLEGFDLHADLAVPGRDRARLEQLCRLCGDPHKRQYADQGVMRTRHPRGWEER